MNKYLYIAILLCAPQIHCTPSVTFIYNPLPDGIIPLLPETQSYIILQNNEQKELACGEQVTIPMKPGENITLLSPLCGLTSDVYYKLDMTLASTNSESNEKPLEARVRNFNALIYDAIKGIRNHSFPLSHHASLKVHVHPSLFRLADKQLVEIKRD